MQAKVDEFEIRVSTRKPARHYVNYATYLINKEGFKFLKISAAGNATTNATILAEMIKRYHGNFHQITNISSLEIIEEF